MAEGDNTNTPEEQKQVTQELAKQEDLLKEMNKSLEKQVNYRARLARMRGEEISEAQRIAMLLGEQADASEELLELAINRETNIEKILKFHMDYDAALRNEVEKGRMLAETAREQTKLSNEILSLKKQILLDTDQENKQADEKLEALIKQLNVQKELTAAQQAGVAAGANLVNSMGSLMGMKPNPAFNDLIRSFSAEGGFAAGMAGVAKGIRTQIGEVFSLGNILGFLGQRLFQLAIFFDGVTASFNAQTGAATEFTSQIAGLTGEMAALGITMDATGASTAALFRDFTMFSELVDENGERNVALQNEIIKTTTSLTKLGIDASESARNMNFLMTALGMTGEEAQKTFRTMIEQGASLNIPPDQLSAALQQLQPRLAMFGQRGPDILMRTAAAAKSLGVSVSELGGNLFALSEGMDEFSETAEKVAAINLTLGGSFVDAFDLTMAAAEGPFAQVELLQQGFERAGQSLGDMPFREQQFLAKNLGMEISTLTAIMDGTIKSQEELNKQQEENPKTIEGMVKKAIPALEKLNASLQGVFGPLSQILTPVASMISGLAETLGSAFAPVVGGLVVMSIGKFILGMRQAKVEATAMATSVANIAKELRLLSLQNKQTNISAILADEEKLIEATKERLAAAGEVTTYTKKAGKETKEFLEKQGKETSKSINDITKSLNEQSNAAEKNAAKMGKMANSVGMVVEGLGTAMTVGSLFVNLLDQLEGGFRAIVGSVLLAAGALGAYAVAKNFATLGPVAGAAAGAAVGAIAAGAYGLITGLQGGGGGTATPAIGSLATQGITTGSGVDDAIIQNDGGSTKITPINKSDQLIAAKPGGPVDEAFQRAGGAEGGQIPERLVAALETIAARMAAPATTNGAGSVNVTVELDRRKMGQAVVDIMNKEMALT